MNHPGDHFRSHGQNRQNSRMIDDFDNKFNRSMMRPETNKHITANNNIIVIKR